MKQTSLFIRYLAIAAVLLIPVSANAGELPAGYPGYFNTVATLDEFGDGKTLIIGDILVHYYDETVVHTLRKKKIDVDDLKRGTNLGFQPIITSKNGITYTSVMELWELPADYVQADGDE